MIAKDDAKPVVVGVDGSDASVDAALWAAMCSATTHPRRPPMPSRLWEIASWQGTKVTSTCDHRPETDCPTVK